MESRAYDAGRSERVKVTRKSVKKTVKKAPIKTVRVRLLKNIRLNKIGAATGIRYSFEFAGSEVDIDERDLPELLAKTTGTTCCGEGQNMSPSPYFELV